MERKNFIKLLATAPLLFTGMKLHDFESISKDFSTTKKMPLLFIGHGHPMNALFDNPYTQAIAKIKDTIEQPNAIMVISAHWETKGTFVSVNPTPKTIYDFGGFDRKLFEVKYEPKGQPELAKELVHLSSNVTIQEDPTMGLDHGAWTVLKHMYPNADIPVFQMSIDYSQPASYHYELGSMLKKMREKGVLIIGSGNIVHNLGILDWNSIDAKPFDWAVEFDELVKKQLNNLDFKSLVNYQQYGRLAQMAIPSNDHYLPMIYILGLSDSSEQIKYLYEGIQYGSISMRCFQIS